ncbi:DUF1284 domain-containing protein [Tumebacillus permanentifrigoris]|uniref:Putative CHY-type Zn-finger protein n=1 Tax=Tumebacillus permanentifrigoris TaxID=378543 RepID=A0A316DZJ6_9BACL|nr:putative CHY-type Zn-finger protein [Tumebacillus permanentifrigoris]
MPIALRGHHLLCLLGYRGMGYSDTYVDNMTGVYRTLLADPTTECEIVSGPDQLCQCFPADGEYHCEDRNVAERDALIVQRLGLQAGQVVSWAEILSRVAQSLQPDDLFQICSTCPWLSYGVCQEGIQRVVAGEELPMVRPKVYGVQVDEQTRCKHYYSEIDIIALKFGCCERYYPCYECHLEAADHPPKPWPRARFDEPAVLCGACGHELTVQAYKSCESKCPSCQAAFNPGCLLHHHLYFE